MTPAVLAQRRSAAVKTGRYAKRPMGALGIPCKRSRCPLESLGGGFDSCPIRRISIERQGAPPEVCTVVLSEGAAPSPQVDVFRKAIEGNLSLLGELQAHLFAEVALIAQQAAVEMRQEGLVTRVHVDGLGEVSQLHAAATALPAFLRILGVDAQQWKLTPASQGQKHGSGDDLGQDMLELYRKTEGTWEAREEEKRA